MMVITQVDIEIDEHITREYKERLFESKPGYAVHERKLKHRGWVDHEGNDNRYLETTIDLLRDKGSYFVEYRTSLLPVF